MKLCEYTFTLLFLCLIRLPCAGDVETRKGVTTWTLGSDISHQQVGNTWSGEKGIISLSLSGDLNVFDPRVGDKPAQIHMVSYFV